VGLRLALLIAGGLALGCGSRPVITRTPSTPDRVWTDAELLDYVVQERGTSGSDGATSAVLGLHHGTKLVQTVSCGDTGCLPFASARVVHYELPKGVTCAAVGGIAKALRVPAGYASRIRQLCFPPILVEHWSDTAPKMSSCALE
jgi:hypothetical protein